MNFISQNGVFCNMLDYERVKSLIILINILLPPTIIQIVKEGQSQEAQ
jgi:hypothetical protein